ncbi:MAG: DAK2 domain-containing protein [Acidimicrobiales bacterium]|nr:DAK2 domain-containing protein [Acidimicrobiales bacterium]
MKAASELAPAQVTAAIEAYRDLLVDHKEAINRLNVYPVPDGDTGTNMALTIQSVVADLERLQQPGPPAMSEVARAMSHGSLMGARGNSGVILSQILRGLAEGLGQVEAVGPGVLAGALEKANQWAWQAVQSPVEGTILSVSQALAAGASRAAGQGADLEGVLRAARDAGAEALAATTGQLEALTRAKVVDAGGAGLLLLFDALLSVVAGRPPPRPDQQPWAPSMPSQAAATSDGRRPEGAEDDPEPGPSVRSQPASGGEEPGDELGPRFEVMYLLEAPDAAIPAFKEVWAGIGESIVVVGGDGLWKCHIHTDDVGAALEAALDVGRPRQIQVTDLDEQVEEERWVREAPAASHVTDEPSEAAAAPVVTAVVAVALGRGIARILRSLGVHRVVEGGQTMNPSTADLLAAVAEVPADQVIVLPNNPNVIPVAMAARPLSTKHVVVLPTPTVPHGFAALMEYDPQSGVEENAEVMEAAAGRVVAGAVTRAVRPAETPAGPVAKGDWLGVSEERVDAIAATAHDAACALLERLLAGRHELVTLFEGEGATAADTRHITEWLKERYPGIETEVHHGGQPLYPYLLSVE